MAVVLEETMAEVETMGVVAVLVTAAMVVVAIQHLQQQLLQQRRRNQAEDVYQKLWQIVFNGVDIWI